MQIEWNDIDRKKVQHLRECLNGGSINLPLLEDLLQVLEGKTEPSTPMQKKKKSHSMQRISRHYEQLTGRQFVPGRK